MRIKDSLEPKANRILFITGLFWVHVSGFVALRVYEENNDIANYILGGFALIALALLVRGVVSEATAAKTIKKKILIVAAWVLAGVLATMGTLYMFNEHYRQASQYPNDYPWSCPEDINEWNCAVIEDHAKKDVANRQETLDLVEQYGSENVTVRALAYDYIADETYMDRLFGDRFESIHCIVFVDWPDGQKIYVETSYHEYEQFTPQEFSDLLTDASDEDLKLLYDNLN